MKFNPFRVVIDNPAISAIAALGIAGAVYAASPPADREICKGEGGTVHQTWRDRLPSPHVTYHFQNGSYNQFVSRPKTQVGSLTDEAHQFCGSGREPGPRLNNVSFPDLINRMR